MTPEEKRDKLLQSIEFNGKPFTSLYKKLIDPNEEGSKIDLFMYQMMEDRLIKYEDKNNVPKDWCFVILDVEGQKIKEAGGYLKSTYG